TSPSRATTSHNTTNAASARATPAYLSADASTPGSSKWSTNTSARPAPHKASKKPGSPRSPSVRQPASNDSPKPNSPASAWASHSATETTPTTLTCTSPAQSSAATSAPDS